MIGKLSGRIAERGEHHVMIDVGGVGYIAFCSARTLRHLESEGTAASLLIETQVREDAITLIGFHDTEEKNTFKLITTVQGVGTKVALSILSTLSPAQLASAIISGDKTLLSSADGVGPKLAARLVTELKDKVAHMGVGTVTAFPKAAATPPSAETSLAGDAVSTLANLGFRKEEAFAAVMAILAQDKSIGFDGLIRASLKELSPRTAKL